MSSHHTLPNVQIQHCNVHPKKSYFSSGNAWARAFAFLNLMLSYTIYTWRVLSIAYISPICDDVPYGRLGLELQKKTYTMWSDVSTTTFAAFVLNDVVRKQENVKKASTLNVKANIVFALERTEFILSMICFTPVQQMYNCQLVGVPRR